MASSSRCSICVPLLQSPFSVPLLPARRRRGSNAAQHPPRAPQRGSPLRRASVEAADALLAPEALLCAGLAAVAAASTLAPLLSAGPAAAAAALADVQAWPEGDGLEPETVDAPAFAVAGGLSALPFVGWSAWLCLCLSPAAQEQPLQRWRYLLFAGVYAAPLARDGLQFTTGAAALWLVGILHLQCERAAVQLVRQQRIVDAAPHAPPRRRRRRAPAAEAAAAGAGFGRAAASAVFDALTALPAFAAGMARGATAVTSSRLAPRKRAGGGAAASARLAERAQRESSMDALLERDETELMELAQFDRRLRERGAAAEKDSRRKDVSPRGQQE